MDVKAIRELVKILEKSNLNELKIKEGEFELHLVKQPKIENLQLTQGISQPIIPQQIHDITSQSSQQVSQPHQKTPSQDVSLDNYIEIKAPMVGTFYRAPSPDAEPYVKEGDIVNPDTVVCIIEAMKLFNEIKAEVKGKIVKVLVENGQPVEYGQPLFLVEPM